MSADKFELVDKSNLCKIYGHRYGGHGKCIICGMRRVKHIPKSTEEYLLVGKYGEQRTRDDHGIKKWNNQHKVRRVKRHSQICKLCGAHLILRTVSDDAHKSLVCSNPQCEAVAK